MRNMFFVLLHGKKGRLGLGMALMLSLILGFSCFALPAGASPAQHANVAQASLPQWNDTDLGFDTVTTTSTDLTPSANTVVAVLPLPKGDYVVDATIPILFKTAHSQVSCQFTVTNGSTDGPIPAKTIGTAPTPGGGVFGYLTLPLTDSISITSNSGKVSVSCFLTKNVGPTPAATVQPGLAITADQKSKLTFVPQP